jgi:hypothetical protein
MRSQVARSDSWSRCGKDCHMPVTHQNPGTSDIFGKTTHPRCPFAAIGVPFIGPFSHG